jgi:hypothetical protein
LQFEFSKDSYLDWMDQNLFRMGKSVGFEVFDLGVNQLHKNVNLSLPIPRFQGTHDKSMTFHVKNRENLYKFPSDNVGKISYGIGSPKYSPVFKLFKDNVEKLFESGILQKLKGIKHNDGSLYNDVFKVVEIPEARYIPISLTMLESGFIIWLVAVGASIVVFFVEIIHFNVLKFVDKHHKKEDLKKSKINSKVKKTKLDLFKKTKWWLKTVFDIIKEKLMHRNT